MVALLLFGILPLCYAATSPVVATAASSTITAAPSRTSAAVLAGSTPLPLTQYSYAYNDVVSNFSLFLERVFLTDVYFVFV